MKVRQVLTRVLPLALLAAATAPMLPAAADYNPTVDIADTTVLEGDSGTTNATFTVTLSKASQNTVSVGWGTVDGTALANVHYVPTAGTVVFTPGVTSKTLTVPVIGNTTPNVPAANRAFTVNLAFAYNASIGVNPGTATIYDDDLLPAISVGAASAVRPAAGATTTMSFPVTLSPASANPVTFRYATTSGSAVAGQDFVGANGVVTIPPGATTASIPVTVIGAGGSATDSGFTLNLATPTNARLQTSSTSGVIQSVRPSSRISVGDVAVARPPSGTAVVQVPVTLSPPSTGTVTVDIATFDSSGKAGVDYNAAAGILTFAPGDTSKNFPVTVLPGATNVGFGVQLATPVGASIVRTSSTINLGTLVPQFTVADAGVVEGDGGTVNAQFVVSLTSPASGPTSVTYQTTNSSAVAGTDFTAVSPTVLSFTAGQTSKTVNVPILPNTIPQADRTFGLSLSAPVGASILRGTAIGTIVDDDRAPLITIADTAIVRSTSGSSTMTFTARLSAASPNPVTVQFATSNGTAVAPTHYTTASGTVTFNPGQTSRPVNVTVAGSPANDSDRTFSMNLGTPTNAVLQQSTAQGLIIDPVQPTQIQVRPAYAFNCEKGIAFDVVLDAPSALPVSVTYGTADGTAKSTSDYTTTTGTLTFAPGTTKQTVVVPVSPSVPLAVGDKFLGFGLSSPVNAVITIGGVNGVLRNQNIQPAITVSDAAVKEGDLGTTTTATFTVSLLPAAINPTSIGFSTADGSANSSSYTPVSGTLTFAPGETSKTVNVTVLGNDAQDGDRAFSLNVSAPAAPAPPLLVLRSGGSGIILDDDVRAVVNVGGTSVQRPATGTRVVDVPVYLSVPSKQTVTVNYATFDSGAVSGIDYNSASGSLTFPPGTTLQTVPVTVKSSSTTSTLNFGLQLSGLLNANIGDNNQTVAIQPSTGAPTIFGYVQSSSVVEGNTGTTTMNVTVRAAPAPTSRTVFRWAATVSGAISPYDFQAARGTVTFNSGDTSKTFPVTVNGDLIDEGVGENLALAISAPLAGTGVGDSTAIGTIIDDDVPSYVTVGDVSVVEGNTGPTTAVFSLQVMPANPFDSSIDLVTGNSTGTVAGRDYVPTTVNVAFPAGTTTATASVPIIPGTTLDPSANKRFVVNFGDSGPLTPARTSGIGLIVDADTFNVTGTVRDSAGGGFSGATIAATGGKAGTSAASGAYVVPDALNGTKLTLTPSGGGATYFPASINNVSVCGADKTKNDFLALTGRFIEGQVLDAKGKAAAGVTVTRSGGGQPNAVATTDSNGYYGFSGNPNGAYTITASKGSSSFAPPTAAVTISGAAVSNVDFLLLTGVTISGRVTDTGGNGVAGVTITRSGGGQPNATFKTNAAGYYGFSSVPATAGGTTYSVQPSKTGKTFTPPGAFVVVKTTQNAVANFTQD